MNVARHNSDLLILQQEAQRPRFGMTPGWSQVDWMPTSYGGNMVFLRNFVLPPVCEPARTHVKIEAPPNLYEPATSGRLHFYRNIWITPNLKVWDGRAKKWYPAPRLSSQDQNGFAYCCIHPGTANETDNVLAFLRILDLHLLNPGLHATSGEQR